MKCCLTENCGQEYLAQADEIKIEWKNRKGIPDVAIKYPEKTIILQFIYHQMKDPQNINWEDIELYNRVCQENFICAVHNYDACLECLKRGIKFYYGYPVDSYWELQGLKNLGVCYARLGPGLFFDMNAVKNIGVPIRAVPNLAFNDTLPHKDGICGQWIRPEDLSMYEEYIDTIEFEDIDSTKEQALYRVYMKQEGWKTNISSLITNLSKSIPASNPLLDSDITKVRLNCKQKCQAGGACQICYRAFDLADKQRLREYFEEIKKK